MDNLILAECQMARGRAGQLTLAWPGECGTTVVRCPVLGNGTKATRHASYRGTADCTSHPAWVYTEATFDNIRVAQ